MDLRNYIDGQVLFVTTAMLEDSGPTTRDRLLLITEGPDDHLALTNFASADLEIQYGLSGKAEVLEAARRAIDEGRTNLRFLVDLDFDAYIGSTSTNLPNVFTSENHDVFMDLLALSKPRLLQKIRALVAVASRAPSRTHSPLPADVLNQALEMAAVLVPLRIVNSRESLGLKFRDFPFGQYTYPAKMKEFAEMVIRRSQNIQIEVQELVAKGEEVRPEIVPDYFHAIGDHDFFASLANSLKSYRSMTARDLQTEFIGAVALDEILTTTWGKQIDEWCSEKGLKAFDYPSKSIAA